MTAESKQRGHHGHVYNSAIVRTLIALLALAVSLLPVAPAAAQCVYGSASGEPYRLSALDVAVDQGRLWVATSHGVTLYDISGDVPLPLSSLPLPGTTSRVRPAGGGLAYVASGSTVYAVRATGSLQVVGSADAGGLINDLLYDPPYVYAATSKGVVQFELFAPDRPVAAQTLTTTSGLAVSLARFDTMLLVADGDATVDVISIAIPSIPQKAGTIASLPRGSSVKVNGGRLYVSDGFQIDVLSPSGSTFSRLALVQGIGALAFFPINSDVAWTAGNDRVLRAVDFTDPSRPAVLFEELISSTGGSVNRVAALAAASEGFLYVAAGDAGLLTFDTRLFREPFPVRSHDIGAMRGVAATGTVVVAAGESAGLVRLDPGADGRLTKRDEWATDKRWSIHDATTDRVLASSGSQLVLWNPVATPPVQLSAATLRTTIRSAVLLNTTAIVVLDDRSMWRVDMAQASAATTDVTPAGFAATSVSRSANTLLAAAANDDGTTSMRYWSSGDPSSAPVSASIEGAATAGVALAPGLAAAVTYKGLYLIDFAKGGEVRLLPRESRPVVDLQFSGPALLLLEQNAVEIILMGDLSARRIGIPGSAVALHAPESTTAPVYVATSRGVASVLRRDDRVLPLRLNAPHFTNEYYRDAAASGRFLFLTDGRNIDWFVISNSIPRFAQRVVAGENIVDLVATASKLVTLSGSGLVTAIPLGAGAPATFQLNEGADSVPLKLHAAGDAIYVSLSRGCLSGACEKKTLVLDSRQGLVQTSTMTGGLVDLVTSGTKGWGVFDLPAEIRALDLADPFHPATTLAKASEGDPVSIAYAAGAKTVYTLGQKLYAYAEQGLVKGGELLDAYSEDPTLRVSYSDQMLRIEGDCALITGRRFSPSLYRVQGATNWTESATLPPVAAAVKRQMKADGSIFLLTDYSLELWRTTPLPLRKRPVR